jgi:transcriptional regulator GlxA family with amidase domain
MDFGGPVSVLHCASNQMAAMGAPNPAYDLVLLSMNGGPVKTLEGVVVQTVAAAQIAVGEFDTLIISGGLVDEASCDPLLVEWVRRNHSKVSRVTSVCSGAFILAATGLLDGRGATTHWEECDHLQRSFPKIKVQPDSIYVRDGKFWTAAGVTSGIDMALALVEEDFGRDLALIVARRLVVFLKRPGGQSQFSVPLQSQGVEGPLGSLLSWIVDHPCEDLRTEALASRMNMSLRTFYRTFESATGVPPAEWVEKARLEIARRLLEQSSEHIDQVAYRSGFCSTETMRKVFARRLGVTPSAYRLSFSHGPVVNAGPIDVRGYADRAPGEMAEPSATPRQHA